MKKKRTFSRIYIGAVLLLMYLPIIVVAVYSFNSTKMNTVWTGFSLQWYQKLFRDAVMLEALKNSLVLAFSASLLSAVIGTVGAVGLVKCKSALNGAVEATAIIPLMIPEIITGMVFLAFFSWFGLRFGMLTLIIAHSSFCVPYVFMMVKSSLAGLDQGIEDAAADLGAGRFRVFWDIILPHILPAAASGTLMAFAMSLDDVVISFFVTGAQVNTLPLKIYSQLKSGVTPEVNALCTLMLAVTLLIVTAMFMIRRKQAK